MCETVASSVPGFGLVGKVPLQGADLPGLRKCCRSSCLCESLFDFCPDLVYRALEMMVL